MHPAGLEPAPRRLRAGCSATRATSASVEIRWLYCINSKYNDLPRQCTGKESNLHHRFRRPGLFPLSYQCVRREGLEPSTSPLSRECSTSELTARDCSTDCSFSNAPGWIRTRNLRGECTALGP